MKLPAWLVAGLGLQAKLPYNWFEALFHLCPCLGSQCWLNRKLSLSPLSWFLMGSLFLGEVRAELGMMAAGTSSKGSSVSFHKERRKLYIMQAASHKPLWSGWWEEGPGLRLPGATCAQLAYPRYVRGHALGCAPPAPQSLGHKVTLSC